MSHHTDGNRPLVLVPEDLPRVEAVPLAERRLPASTYELLRHTAAGCPRSPALHLLGEGPETTWSYAELLSRVHQAANLYTSLGLSPGGTVGLLLPNTGITYAALLGAQAVGAASPVNPMLAEQHIIDILTMTRAEILVAAGPSLDRRPWQVAQRVAAGLPGLKALLLIGDAPCPRAGIRGDSYERLAAAQPGDGLVTGRRPDPADVAAYFHTGGTTGTPKIAPHTHAMEVYMAWALGCTGAYASGEAVALAGLPLFHVNAVHVTGLAPFMHAASVVSLGPAGYRDRQLMANFWQIIERYRVTAFSAVPTVYASLPPVPGGVDISSLKAGAVGAAPLPGRVRVEFEQNTKVPMLEGYGLTEATCASAATPALAPRAGSVGLRLPYQQIKAVTIDSAGRPIGDCAPGQTGVVAISGPAVFPGYLGPDGPDPAGQIFDGWLLTGDLGQVDADGYVYLTGRAKDLIIRGGHNIDPRSVEESLLAHPAVKDAAVIGRPDPHSGEVPVGYVTVTSEVTESDLLAWANAHAPEPAAAPKAVHVTDTLPVTAVGKIFKPALVADTIQRLIGELNPSTPAKVVVEDGRPVALLPDDPELAAALDRYAVTYRIVAS
jgi:fatty-acyl-CoA synthase